MKKDNYRIARLVKGAARYKMYYFDPAKTTKALKKSDDDFDDRAKLIDQLSEQLGKLRKEHREANSTLEKEKERLDKLLVYDKSERKSVPKKLQAEVDKLIQTAEFSESKVKRFEKFSSYQGYQGIIEKAEKSKTEISRLYQESEAKSKEASTFRQNADVEEDYKEAIKLRELADQREGMARRLREDARQKEVKVNRDSHELKYALEKQEEIDEMRKEASELLKEAEKLKKKKKRAEADIVKLKDMIQELEPKIGSQLDEINALADRLNKLTNEDEYGPVIEGEEYLDYEIKGLYHGYFGGEKYVGFEPLDDFPPKFISFDSEAHAKKAQSGNFNFRLIEPRQLKSQDSSKNCEQEILKKKYRLKKGLIYLIPFHQIEFID